MGSVRERRRQRSDIIDGMPVAAIACTTDTAEEVQCLLEVDGRCRWIAFVSDFRDDRATAMNVHSYARKRKRKNGIAYDL